MSEQIHHPVPGTADSSRNRPPLPSAEPSRWKESLLRTFGDDQDTRWGKRLVRVASDMVVVCDENLEVIYHNRSFLRGVGHQAGTFVGVSLLDFFPEEDLADAEAAFGRLLGGRSAGMRIQATFLTQRGRRQFDARVTRSRRGAEAFFLYFVIRDETLRSEETAELEAKAIEPLLMGLPVAAFRTNKRLRITHAFGELWEEAFSCNPKSLIGVDLTDGQCQRSPRFLQQIDYCDTMAGLTLHTDFAWEESSYSITVEPFLDEKKRILGSIAMIRLMKRSVERSDSEELPFLTAGDVVGNGRNPRVLQLTGEALEEEIKRIRGSIRPLSPQDLSSDPEEDLVALSN